MKRVVVLFLGFFAIAINFAFAQKPAVVTDNDPGWHKIGEITASFEMDSESIIVYGRDEFQKIKLKVTDAPINIDKVQVFYEEGGSQELSLADELSKGGETRVIDLDGTNKELEKVVFTYKTLPNYQGDKATVELYGLKTRQDKSDAFRDDNDGESDVEEEVEQTRDELKEESKEARDEYKEEKRETKEDLKTETREAKEEAKEAKSDIERGAENTGDDISEAAVNAASHIKDKVYVDKVGPAGQTIYIDKHSKYYYVSDEGKKIFITKAEMKNKPNKD